MGFLVPLITAIGGGLLANHSKKQQAKAAEAAQNAQAQRDYDIQAARRKSQVARYRVKLALVRSWLEQHPDRAAKAPKEYLQAVYNPQITEMPKFAPQVSSYKGPSTLGTIAQTGLKAWGDYAKEQRTAPEDGQPQSGKGGGGLLNALTPRQDMGGAGVQAAPNAFPDWGNQRKW